MSGRLVSATSLDSVRIEVLGGSRALTVPADFILAVDRVFRFCLQAESSLDIDMVEDDRTSWQGWEASCEVPDGDDPDEILIAHGDTPWGAVIALAKAIESRR